jgi:hypothetical protein
MFGFIAGIPNLGRIVLILVTIVTGFVTGWAINGWRLNADIASLKASHAQEVARYYQEARKAEKSLIEAVEGLRRTKDAEIKAISGKLQSALGELRQRQDRPSSSDTARDCKGTTGAELSRQDAEFLTREAARADQLRSALELCYRQYDAVRGVLIGPK